MDFASLINKEIKKKKQSHKVKLKKSKVIKTPDLAEDPEVGNTKNEIDVKTQEEQFVKKDDNELNKVEKNESQTPELTEDQINERLNALNALDESLSKEEKLKRLQYLIQLDIRNKKYKVWLDKEEEYYQDPEKQEITLKAIVNAELNKSILRIQIRISIKQIFHDWEQQAITDEDKSLLKETKKGILKLLYKLRTDKLSTEMLISLSTIFYHIQTNEFNKANESYMKLSIGNVCWPIGVVNVGIHARSSSSRITGSKSVSNIMINDSTRRWIISVKRLINYKEKKFKELKGYKG
ncbi:hypothetical protein KGF54_005051 [Candida jiufengensis]|uniref:uncharacterized protein n=1 Tax=Candida jiufengensis TaxID=497108 RepID=UPI0022240AFC|nr:uncharacterized protein KGF54_005051 [Candida jiufengensis]KAI5951976.1 hypothetical protein KGF54_005051 [Candida jiufengensis]